MLNVNEKMKILSAFLYKNQKPAGSPKKSNKGFSVIKMKRVKNNFAEKIQYFLKNSFLLNFS